MTRYPNLLAEYGYSEAEIDAKIETIFRAIFEDPETRFYHEREDGTAYMRDTGNDDARSEGMSYGMMMAVQLDRQDIFDKLWAFSTRYMLQTEGKYRGYFAWSVAADGAHNAEGPAPDGEEFFAMALFLASARWGEGPAPRDYAAQGRTILRHALHQPELEPEGRAMWDPDNYLIRFVPETDWSDPSYHVPHFYERFAEWADEGDRAFWRRAAAASRDYIEISAHPETGMSSEYAAFDGTPVHFNDKKQEYYSDSYRVALNIGLDASWTGGETRHAAIVERLQHFFATQTTLGNYSSYLIDGTDVGPESMHPWALTSCLAAGSLAARGPWRRHWVEAFWALEPRTGERRYYDNCLYFFSLLALAGRYRAD